MLFRCADSANGPTDKRRKPGLCTGGGEHSAASLRCFSQCLAGKPDYVQPVPSSKNHSAILCADSVYGLSENQIVPGLCLGSERHSTALLCPFSRVPCLFSVCRALQPINNL